MTSPDFLSGGRIPERYTCDGENINPTLVFGGVPREAKSLALVLEDPDAPAGTFIHWIIWNIPSDIDQIKAGSLPLGTVEGLNSLRKKGYVGPCPPVGTHNYIFTLYALDTTLPELDPENTTRIELFEKMTGHILMTAELVGLYSRS